MLTQDDLAQKERGKDLTTQGSGRRPTGEQREGAKMEKQTTRTGETKPHVKNNITQK